MLVELWAPHVEDVDIALVDRDTQGRKVLLGHLWVPPLGSQGVAGVLKALAESRNRGAVVPVTREVHAVPEAGRCSVVRSHIWKLRVFGNGRGK